VVGDWCILIKVAVSCETSSFSRVKGGAVADWLTSPPIMGHVSVNQSNIIVTVSCASPISNTWWHTSPEGQDYPTWDSQRRPALRDRQLHLRPWALQSWSHCPIQTIRASGFQPHLRGQISVPIIFIVSPCPNKRCTVKSHWPTQMASKRGYLGTVTLKHDSSEKGTGRCTISVTNWNDGLGGCREISMRSSYW